MIPKILTFPNPPELVSLSMTALLPENKAAEIWKDFVHEVNDCVVSGKDFVYPDLVTIAPEIHTFYSLDYVDRLLSGKITLEKFIQKIKDPRKVHFAGIIYYLLDQASFGPVYFEGLGMFYLRAQLPKITNNPQTGQPTKMPLEVVLAFSTDNETWIENNLKKRQSE